MPQVIPPKQTTDDYSPSGFQYPASESGGNPYVSGYVIIAPVSSVTPTTGVWVSVLVGPSQGQAQWQEEIPVPPGVLPLQMNIAAGTPDYIYGVRTRNLIAGTNAICSGALYGPGEVAMIPQAGGGVGPPFSPGGPIPPGPGAIIYDFTVTAASKSSIDTLNDGSYAGLLPQGFNVIEIWGMVRTNEASIISQCAIYFNNDSTVGNYNVQYVYGVNTTPLAGRNTAPPGFDVHGNLGDANYAGIFQVSIPGYSQTTFNKIALGGEGRVDTTVANQVSLFQIIGWRNTDAINRIVLVPFPPATTLLLGSRLIIMAR